MTTIIDLLEFEEGWRDRPYLCSENYPTVGYGFKLGPKWEHSLKDFQRMFAFSLPKPVGDFWLGYLTEKLALEIASHPATKAAWAACAGNLPRQAVLLSMAFQMGLDGLAKFLATLNHIAKGRFELASRTMMQSRWAEQTPRRARRHAEQMRTGQWDGAYRK